MPGPRSIQYRLTLLFFAITLTAFAGIFLFVVPQLQTNLREQKLHDLADSAGKYSGELGRAIGSRAVETQVALIRRRVALAGAIAVAFAALAGFFVARALSRRIKRLEQAAEKVAAGDFSQSIPPDSDDELGQLAKAFNDMQRQLAQLDTARKRFIATASHELRTPIFSLAGFVELLQDEELDEEER